MPACCFLSRPWRNSRGKRCAAACSAIAIAAWTSCYRRNNRDKPRRLKSMPWLPASTQLKSTWLKTSGISLSPLIGPRAMSMWGWSCTTRSIWRPLAQYPFKIAKILTGNGIAFSYNLLVEAILDAYKEKPAIFYYQSGSLNCEIKQLRYSLNRS